MFPSGGRVRIGGGEGGFVCSRADGADAGGVTWVAIRLAILRWDPDLSPREGGTHRLRLQTHRPERPEVNGHLKVGVPMPIIEVTIKGYRGFATDQRVRFAVPTGAVGSGLTVLVGPNNGGKSSVIEALQALTVKGAVSFSEGVGAGNSAVVVDLPRCGPMLTSCTALCTASWLRWFASLCARAARRTSRSSCCATN